MCSSVQFEVREACSQRSHASHSRQDLGALWLQVVLSVSMRSGSFAKPVMYRENCSAEVTLGRFHDTLTWSSIIHACTCRLN